MGVGWNLAEIFIDWWKRCVKLVAFQERISWNIWSLWVEDGEKERSGRILTPTSPWIHSHHSSFLANSSSGLELWALLRERENLEETEAGSTFFGSFYHKRADLPDIGCWWWSGLWRLVQCNCPTVSRASWASFSRPPYPCSNLRQSWRIANQYQVSHNSWDSLTKSQIRCSWSLSKPSYT